MKTLHTSGEGALVDVQYCSVGLFMLYVLSDSASARLEYLTF